MRSRRILILKEGMTIDDLDLWPHDEVWSHNQFVHLGTVNEKGVFVSNLMVLN